jgi:hypothetical protein
MKAILNDVKGEFKNDVMFAWSDYMNTIATIMATGDIVINDNLNDRDNKK